MRINSEEDAKRLESILVPREWYTHQLLVKRGFTNLQATRTAQQMIQMLFTDRAPVMFATKVSLPSLIAKYGKQMDDVKMVFPMVSVFGYIGFSKDTSPQVIQMLQQEIDNMKQDGTFAKVYAKWMIDEKPQEWVVK